MTRVHLASWPTAVRVINFNVGHDMQTYQPYFSPGMRKGTIDFYHFRPLSMTLTLAGVTRSEQRTIWLQFLTHISTDQDEIESGVKAIEAEHLNTNLSDTY